MTHTYDVVLDGQLGQRFGQLRWKENRQQRGRNVLSARRSEPNSRAFVRETRLYSRTS